MDVKINNKEYTLHFGWDFLEFINDVRGAEIKANGQGINTKTAGLSFLEAGLESKDPTAVRDAIKAGLSTEKSKPSNEDVEDFVKQKLVKTPKQYKDFVEELHEEIKKEPMLKAIINL